MAGLSRWGDASNPGKLCIGKAFPWKLAPPLLSTPLTATGQHPQGWVQAPSSPLNWSSCLTTCFSLPLTVQPAGRQQGPPGGCPWQGPLHPIPFPGTASRASASTAGLAQTGPWETFPDSTACPRDGGSLLCSPSPSLVLQFVLHHVVCGCWPPDYHVCPSVSEPNGLGSRKFNVNHEFPALKEPFLGIGSPGCAHGWGTDMKGNKHVDRVCQAPQLPPTSPTHPRSVQWKGVTT